MSLSVSKLLIAVVVISVAATVASAYTIVMRDGRRVEIPNQFTITKSGLTYEVGQGLQVTIQMSSIDVAATERANGQPGGSFLRQASEPPKPVAGKVQTRPQAKRSITNRDLDVYRRERVKSEIAYEQRRKELGLPSFEEQRQRAEEIQERTREQLLSMRADEQEAEAYWRGRADELRLEMVENQAQIDFVQRRIDEIPTTFVFGSLATTIPFGTVATPITAFPFQNLITPNVFAPSLVTGLQANVNINTGRRHSPFVRHPGRRHSPVMNRPGHRFNRFNRGQGHGPFSPFFGGNLLGIPFEDYGYSGERDELVSQMNDLLMQRAAMKARWRELEEDARQAGAYPGWLRRR